MHWAKNASLNTIAEDHATRFGVDLAGQTGSSSNAKISSELT
jgi:hypothetical protein